VSQIVEQHPAVFAQENWRPYGGIESNFSVVDNQQAAPVPALAEKLTNAIDAILMRRAHEEGIDPASPEAPRSIRAAIERFFPDHRDWDLPGVRQERARGIQILAHGRKSTPSLVVYDDGEGQHPRDFEDTFLSLLRGNKTEIHFVQGKYNMGGTGALVFCGSRRYQLIGSRRYDRSGPFGFTLLRRHRLTGEERHRKRARWYEFLQIDGRIPSFDPAGPLNLGLHERTFETGSVVKLYSYNLPSSSVISRDLNRDLNEYLYEPALPLYTVERRRDKYPHDKNPARDLYGLKRRLEQQREKYLDDVFSINCEKEEIGGAARITCYVFKPRVDGKSVRETRKAVRNEFFRNKMSVLFSMNGQVHGYYTSEFITRSLKFSFLKKSLLIHVDCTTLDVEFRGELFMASRDRLKQGDESTTLRHAVADVLKKSRLKDIDKQRRNAISVESDSTDDLVRQFADNLPMNPDMTRLLNQTLALDKRRNGDSRRKGERPGRDSGSSSGSEKGGQNGDDESTFAPQRYPSFLRLRSGRLGPDGRRAIKTPRGGERTLQLETDVEDAYFDRIDDPGELRISLLDYHPSGTDNGDAPGLPDRIDEVFDVVKASPHEGIIRVTLAPKVDVAVGDSVQTRITLTGAGQDFEAIFWAKITERRSKSKKRKPKDDLENLAGLPELTPVYQSADDGTPTWDDVANAGVEMDYATVMHPQVEGEKLDAILVNMNSRVLMDYKSDQRGEEAVRVAEKRYLSSVYFHTLFLYMITKRRGYEMHQPASDDAYARPEPIDLTDYLKDVFDSQYSAFLLNFETGDLIEALAD
jgi:hypothetical protein